MTMPSQKPGRSRQDWQTPPEFLEAVKSRLRIVDFERDLAASADNTVCPYFFDETDNALVKDWRITRYEPYSLWFWLNPPYADIGPWVAKCVEESQRGAHIACLVPASTGANWWRDHVVNDAYILYLNGRLTFVGADGPYPKDLALLLYTPFVRSGSATWNWRLDVPAVPAEQAG